jgi:hypothetical protein
LPCPFFDPTLDALSSSQQPSLHFKAADDFAILEGAACFALREPATGLEAAARAPHTTFCGGPFLSVVSIRFRIL